MQLDWTTFLLQVVNFLVLVWLLKRFLYRPVLDVVARRQAGIDKAMADARQLEARAQAQRGDYERKLAELDALRAERLAALAEEVAAERGRRLARLDAELASERARREALAARAAADAATRLEARAREAAMRFLVQLLGRLGGVALDGRLIDLFVEDLAELDDSRVAALREAAAAPGAALQVTSARELGSADRERLAAALAAVLQRPLPLETAVDPALRSGVRVGLGPWLLAASLADELAFFRAGPLSGTADAPHG